MQIFLPKKSGNCAFYLQGTYLLIAEDCIPCISINLSYISCENIFNEVPLIFTFTHTNSLIWAL